MTHRPSRRARILVTDVGTGCGLAMARDLHAAGHHVVGVDASRRSPGLWSRAVGTRRLVPSFEHDTAAVDAVLRVAAEVRADLLVPVTEKAAVALDGRRDEAEAVVPLALPRSDALRRAMDKERTLELARSLGVPVPASIAASCAAEARDAAGQLGWPVVVKPVSSQVVERGGVKTHRVSVVADEAQLEAILADPATGPPCLVQRFVAGTGVGVELLLHEGRVLAAFQHRRLREVPPWGGMSSYRESVELDEDLLRHATALLGALCWTGLAMVEFRVGPDGPALMEINGRPWGSMALPVRAGLRFPSLLAATFLDGPPPPGTPPATDYRRGVRCRHLALDLEWAATVALSGGTRFGARHRRREVVGVLLGLLDPRNDFDVQTLADPLPGLIDAVTAVATVAAHSASRLVTR